MRDNMNVGNVLVEHILARLPGMLWIIAAILIFWALKLNEQRTKKNIREDFKENIKILTDTKNVLKEEKEETIKRLNEYKNIAEEKDRAILEKDKIIINTQKVASQALTDTQIYQAQIQNLKSDFQKVSYAAFALDWMFSRQDFISRYLYSISITTPENKEKTIEFVNKTYPTVLQISIRNVEIKNKIFKNINIEYSERLFAVLSEEYLKLPIKEEIAIIKNIEDEFTNINKSKDKIESKPEDNQLPQN